MKRKILGVSAVILTIVLIVLAACSNLLKPVAPLPTAAASASPSPAVPSSNLPPLVQSSPSLEPPPPDVIYTVKTDFSQLTAYTPMEEIYTRLSDHYMPELVPSDDYGTLLPYVGELLYTDYGYEGATYEGLVTENGMIVTDAVYTDISRLDNSLPIYVLQRQLEGFISEDPSYEDPDAVFKYALCAADGSWVTPFDYTGVRLRDQTIVLLRDLKNDADVFDLTGKFLYNTRSMPYIESVQDRAFLYLDDLRQRRDVSYSDINVLDAVYYGTDEDRYGECYYPVEMIDGKYAFINELTGEITYTDFDGALEFSDGLSAVSKNGLWGYIDQSFNVVIPVQFIEAHYFFSGHALVSLSEDEHAVIDTNGEMKLRAEYIGLWYDMYDADQKGNTSYYDIKLNKITPGKETCYMCPIGGGRYLAESDDQCELFFNSQKYVFPGVVRVLDVVDGLAVCQMRQNDTWGKSLLTLDGKTVIRFLENTEISPIQNAATGDVYISIYNHNDNTSRIKTLSGKTLISSDGSIFYDALSNMFGVQSEQYFSYMDINSNCVFQISLMASIPD